MQLCPYRIFVPLSIGIDQGITTGAHRIRIFSGRLGNFLSPTLMAQTNALPELGFRSWTHISNSILCWRQRPSDMLHCIWMERPTSGGTMG
jgi:hypothetical protein